MGKLKRPAARLLPGERVIFISGLSATLGIVVEMTGPREKTPGDRRYTIRYDPILADPVDYSRVERELLRADEADVASWESRRSLALHRTYTYAGTGRDEFGRPDPLHYNLVIVRAGDDGESATAYIVPMLRRKPVVGAFGAWKIMTVDAGGPDAAFAEVEAFLDGEHPGLAKTVSSVWDGEVPAISTPG